jgi:starvation-inducible DNA-binding protein
MVIELGIPQNRREHARDLLFKILSNYYILTLKTQNYHWNVTGPHFHSYHRMLEEQYNNLEEGIDELAERIRILGFPVQANYKTFINEATLKEEGGAPDAQGMLKNLAYDHGILIREIREAIDKLKETEDEGTTDLLVERLRYHEETAWILRSHLS